MDALKKSKKELVKKVQSLRSRLEEFKRNKSTPKKPKNSMWESEEKFKDLCEEALRSEKNKLIGVFKAMADGVYIVNKQHDIEYVNPVLEKEFGLWEGRKCYEYFHDRKEICPWCKNEDVFAGRTVRWEWYSFKNQKTYDLIDTPLMNPDGSISKLEIFRDITERKRVERELKESKERYKALFKGAPDGIIVADIETGQYIHVNPSICKRLGYSEEEIKGLSQFRGIHPKGDTDRIKRLFFMQARGELDIAEDIPFVKKDGTIRYFDVNSVVVEINGIQRVIGLLRDITDRKRTEEALREGEERFRTLFESAPDAIYITDLQGRFVDGNRIAEELCGYKKEQLIGMNFVETGLLSVEQLPKALEDLKKSAAGQPTGPDEFVLKKKDGSFVTLEIRTFPVKISDKILVLGIGRDITKRKQTETELRQAKEFIDNAINAQVDTFFVFNPKTGKAIRWNENFSRISGYIDEEISVMKAPDSYYDQDDLEKAYESLKELTATGSATVELSLITKKGTRIPFEYKVSLIEITSGENVAISIGRDITERKKAEEALHESETRYRELFDNMSSGVAVYEPVENGRDFVFKNLNRAGEQIDKIKKEDVVGKKVTEMFPGVDEFGLLDIFRRVYKTGKPEHHPVTLYKDGRHSTWFDNYVYKLPSGEIVAVHDDVTERKKAEEALIEKEVTIRAIVETSRDWIWAIDFNGVHTYMNPAVERILGYLPEELIGRQSLNLMHEEDRKKIAKKLPQWKKQKSGWNSLVIRWRHKDGGYRYLESNAVPILDAQGDLRGFRGVDRDIAERKEAEKRNLDYQERLKSLASQLSLAEERERRRLAAEVHDNIGQNLALAKLTLQSLMKSSSVSDVSASLNEVCGIIDKMAQDAHSLTFELSNPVLYELGFETAVEAWLAEQIREKYGLQYKLTVDKQGISLDNEVSVILFQAVRELLVNVAKHAKAKTVNVRIRQVDDRVQVSVEDDGVGFVRTEPSLSPKKEGGFGLFNIQERLEYLGGELKIESSPGNGTSIMLVSPLRYHHKRSVK